jgi:hypothetical protein
MVILRLCRRITRKFSSQLKLECNAVSLRKGHGWHRQVSTCARSTLSCGKTFTLSDEKNFPPSQGGIDEKIPRNLIRLASPHSALLNHAAQQDEIHSRRVLIPTVAVSWIRQNSRHTITIAQSHPLLFDERAVLGCS